MTIGATGRPRGVDGGNLDATLRKRYDAMVQAVTKADMGQVLSLYDADAVLLPPKGNPMSGIRAVQGYFKRSFAEGKTLSETLTPTERIVSGDYVIDTVFLRASFEMKGQILHPRVKMLYIWHRGTDGQWRIARDMWARA